MDEDRCPICFVRRNNDGTMVHHPGCPDKPETVEPEVTESNYRYSPEKAGITNVSDETE